MIGPLMTLYQNVIILRLLANSAINRNKINRKVYLKITKMKSIKSIIKIIRSLLIIFGWIKMCRAVQPKCKQILFIINHFKAPLSSLFKVQKIKMIKTIKTISQILLSKMMYKSKQTKNIKLINRKNK
jgi:hypothetical protein